MARQKECLPGGCARRRQRAERRQDNGAAARPVVAAGGRSRARLGGSSLARTGCCSRDCAAAVAESCRLFAHLALRQVSLGSLANLDLGKWNFAPEARGQRRRSAGLSRSPAEMMEGKEEDFLDFICCFLWDPLPFLKAKTFLLDFPQPQRKIDDPFLFFHSHRLHELISQIDEIPESSKTRRSERSSRSKQQVKTSPKRQEIYRKEGGGAAPLGI